MYWFIVIFLIIADILAIFSIVYVILDLIFGRKKKEEPEEQEMIVVPVVTPVVAPEPEPEVVPVVIPIVDHVDAEEADELISDEVAMETVKYEWPAGKGKQGIINIGDLDKLFEPNSVITLSVLKELGLMPKKVKRIKILADGVLTKPLTIKAENYSVQAIKMIELTGGTVIILIDEPKDKGESEGASEEKAEETT
jgi:large subunit ribosomal protein L15